MSKTTSPTNKLGRKQQLSALSGAIVTILVFAVPAFTDFELPIEVATAAVSLAVTVIMTAVSYQVRPAARDVYPNETKTDAVPVLKRDVIE